MDVWVVSTFWPVWIMLLCPKGFKIGKPKGFGLDILRSGRGRARNDGNSPYCYTPSSSSYKWTCLLFSFLLCFLLQYVLVYCWAVCALLLTALQCPSWWAMTLFPVTGEIQTWLKGLLLPQSLLLFFFHTTFPDPNKSSPDWVGFRRMFRILYTHLLSPSHFPHCSGMELGAHPNDIIGLSLALTATFQVLLQEVGLFFECWFFSSVFTYFFSFC